MAPATKYVPGYKIQTNRSGICEIERFISKTEVWIVFPATGYRKLVKSTTLSSGEIRDPYAPTIAGIGFEGEGKYSKKSHTKDYYLFKGMHTRCNPNTWKNKYATYVGCSVDSRWHCLQDFCRDIRKMKNWNKEGFQLDKDLRVWGNKIYGPDTCSFVPVKINSVLSEKPHRGKYGAGVKKDHHKYAATIKTDIVPTHLGMFPTAKEARAAYKEARESYIRSLAKEYKSVLHLDVYRNLRNYVFIDPLDKPKKKIRLRKMDG